MQLSARGMQEEAGARAAGRASPAAALIPRLIAAASSCLFGNASVLLTVQCKVEEEQRFYRADCGILHGKACQVMEQYNVIPSHSLKSIRLWTLEEHAHTAVTR